MWELYRWYFEKSTYGNVTADGGLWSIIDDDAKELRRPVIGHGILTEFAGGSPCS